MNAVAMLLLLLTSGNAAEKKPEPIEEMTLERMAVRTFNFSRDVENDILFVAEETMVDPVILAVLISWESDGLYTAIGYCTKWKKVKKGEPQKCLEHKSCRTGCQGNKKIWKNHLALGLWQLWDTSTSSWIRWYSEHVEKIGASCAMDRMCARKVMIAVVNHLQTVKPRECGEDSPCMWDSGWISRWNGCGFCEKVVLKSWDVWDKVQALAPPEMFDPENMRDSGRE